MPLRPKPKTIANAVLVLVTSAYSRDCRDDMKRNADHASPYQ